MATLVLTVVGGIVGGPVGAAIGAAIGQQADAAIFKPKGREGPRLADLKVQASTYGQQIPQMFGTARLQWTPRNGTALTEVEVPGGAVALRPLAPVHGCVRRAGGTGGADIVWVRRSRADAGWRDHVDLPVGEGRAAWRVALVPPVPGAGPWECVSPELHISGAVMAALPPGCAVEIRQIGDFALSPPLSLPLT